jgi:hypothetical protein
LILAAVKIHYDSCRVGSCKKLSAIISKIPRKTTWGPEYINSQVKGAMESGQIGFIFWNAKADYLTVEKALSGK